MINLRNLQEIRQDEDISQEQMASILGVKRDALAKWETCVTLPSLKHVYNFAKHFNFTIDYILGINHDRTRVEYAEYNEKLIANNLRNLRLNANLTLMKLSEKLGVSYNAIVRYEHNRCNPSINVIYRYTQIFNISFHKLCSTKIEKSESNLKK